MLRWVSHKDKSAHHCSTTLQDLVHWYLGHGTGKLRLAAVPLLTVVCLGPAPSAVGGALTGESGTGVPAEAVFLSELCNGEVRLGVR